MSINDPDPLSDAYVHFKNLPDNSSVSIISDMNIRREFRANIVKDISSKFLLVFIKNPKMCTFYHTS